MIINMRPLGLSIVMEHGRELEVAWTRATCQFAARLQLELRLPLRARFQRCNVHKL